MSSIAAADNFYHENGDAGAQATYSLKRRGILTCKRTKILRVAYFIGRTEEGKQTFTERMKRKLDSIAGRVIYGMRLAIGEPPFAHIKSALGLDRFSLRGKKKVNLW